MPSHSKQSSDNSNLEVALLLYCQYLCPNSFPEKSPDWIYSTSESVAISTFDFQMVWDKGQNFKVTPKCNQWKLFCWGISCLLGSGPGEGFLSQPPSTAVSFHYPWKSCHLRGQELNWLYSLNCEVWSKSNGPIAWICFMSKQRSSGLRPYKVKSILVIEEILLFFLF